MANSRPFKPQRLVSSSTVQNKNNQRKFYQHIIFKVIIVVLSVVIILVLPSDLPDVENPTIFDRGWELLQLILVGIVVSYGLFSRKNDEVDRKNDEIEGNFDSGSQSYVSSLLNVTSEVFRVENGNLPSGFVDNDENDDDRGEKIRTWNLEYVRNEPVTVVNEKSGKSCVIDKNCGVISGEKPLLLPVRSLKSRVCNENESNGVTRVFTRSLTDPVAGFNNSSKGLGDDSRVSDEKDGNLVSRVGTRSNRSKSFSTSSRELGGIDCIGYRRSNSSPDAKEFTSDSRIGVGSELGFVNGDKKLSKSMSRSNSSAKDFSSISRKSISGNDGKLVENKEKVEESVVFPSPIPWQSRSGRMVIQGESYDTSSTHSLPPSLEQSEAARLLKRTSNYGLHLPPPPPPPPPPPSATNRSRRIKTPQKDLKRNDESFNSKNEESKVKTRNEVELTDAKNTNRRSIDFFEKVLMESDDESESEDERVETTKADDNEPPSENVDKKADEFIARFREQIRLQRIDSIKKSTGQLKRNFGR